MEKNCSRKYCKKDISNFWDDSRKNCTKFKKDFFRSNAMDSSTAISIWSWKNESPREKFWRSYPQKTLESSIGIQFCWWYSPRQKKQIDGGEKAPVERSEAKVKLRFDTIIKIGSKCHNKRLEKIVSREHNICFACIAAVKYSLVWAQKDLREGEKRPRLHCPRMETVHFIQ